MGVEGGEASGARPSVQVLAAASWRESVARAGWRDRAQGGWGGFGALVGSVGAIHRESTQSGVQCNDVAREHSVIYARTRQSHPTALDYSVEGTKDDVVTISPLDPAQGGGRGTAVETEDLKQRVMRPLS